MKICDDCFEEYHGRKCPHCFPPKGSTTYTKERCIYIWQVYHSRGGFDTDEQLKEYANVKKSYKSLTGKDLPKLQEKVIKRKGGKDA